jgi:hypothetical protein
MTNAQDRQKRQTPYGDVNNPTGPDMEDPTEPARRAPGPEEEQHRRPDPLDAPGQDHESEDQPSDPQKKIA